MFFKFEFYHIQKEKEVFIIKILAFDQALIKTGVCTLDDGTAYHSLIDLSKIKNADERRATMRHMIQSQIKNNHPDLVAIEDVALQSSAKTVIQLAQLQGAIIGACEMFNIPYEILRPSEWRKTLGFKQGRQIKRPELKQQAIDYVAEHYGEVVSSDEADAMCIAKATRLRLENKLNQED